MKIATARKQLAASFEGLASVRDFLLGDEAGIASELSALG